MNAELIAHGFANGLSGMFGGLQTYMTYSNSVLYAKSGGKGKISSLAIVVLTIVLFVIGPSIASYLPRCMAGTLLLHIGIDLVLEGVYDCEYMFLDLKLDRSVYIFGQTADTIISTPIINSLWKLRSFGVRGHLGDYGCHDALGYDGCFDCWRHCGLDDLCGPVHQLPKSHSTSFDGVYPS